MLSFQSFLFLAVCAFAVVRGDLEEITSKVFFDIQIGSENAGRVVMGLFGNTVPKVRMTTPQLTWHDITNCL